MDEQMRGRHVAPQHVARDAHHLRHARAPERVTLGTHVRGEMEAKRVLGRSPRREDARRRRQPWLSGLGPLGLSVGLRVSEPHRGPGDAACGAGRLRGPRLERRAFGWSGVVVVRARREDEHLSLIHISEPTRRS
eukprot:2430353-Prymnesium_polylepis.2